MAQARLAPCCVIPACACAPAGHIEPAAPEPPPRRCVRRSDPSTGPASYDWPSSPPHPHTGGPANNPRMPPASPCFPPGRQDETALYRLRLRKHRSWRRHNPGALGVPAKVVAHPRIRRQRLRQRLAPISTVHPVSHSEPALCRRLSECCRRENERLREPRIASGAPRSVTPKLSLAAAAHARAHPRSSVSRLPAGRDSSLLCRLRHFFPSAQRPRSAVACAPQP